MLTQAAINSSRPPPMPGLLDSARRGSLLYLHLGTSPKATPRPVAVPAGKGHLGVGIGLDPLRRLIDDVELPVGTHPAHAEPLIGVLGLRVQLDLAFGGVELDAA